MTNGKRPIKAVAALLAIALIGCVDLNVVNPNEPDTGRVIRTPGDVEALVSGAFSRWMRVLWYNGPTMMMSNASGEHVAPWANAGMEHYARIPRVPTTNAPGAADVGNLTYAWYQAYAALAALSAVTPAALK